MVVLFHSMGMNSIMHNPPIMKRTMTKERSHAYVLSHHHSLDSNNKVKEAKTKHKPFK